MIVVAVVVVIFVVFVKGVGEDSQDDLAAPSTERLGSVNSPHVMTESSSFTATDALASVKPTVLCRTRSWWNVLATFWRISKS